MRKTASIMLGALIGLLSAYAFAQNQTLSHHLNEAVSTYKLPTISSLPDPTYTHKESIRWEGGEIKFGPWRQYFNAFEKGWLLTYNAPFNMANNTFQGRDSGDTRANIVIASFFNTAEGASGANSYNLWFAPPAAAGVAPDFNAATRYTWFDGRTGGSPVAGRFRIETAANMPAVLQLRAHSTVAPSDYALVSEIDNTWSIYRAYETLPVKVVHGDANGNLTAIGQIRSTLPTGTAPFQVSSKTKVANLTSERVEIVTTASLPTAGAAEDGRIMIEDCGTNCANIVIYKGGQRFRASVWQSF